MNNLIERTILWKLRRNLNFSLNLKETIILLTLHIITIAKYYKRFQDFSTKDTDINVCQRLLVFCAKELSTTFHPVSIYETFIEIYESMSDFRKVRLDIRLNSITRALWHIGKKIASHQRFQQIWIPHKIIFFSVFSQKFCMCGRWKSLNPHKSNEVSSENTICWYCGTAGGTI